MKLKNQILPVIAVIIYSSFSVASMDKYEGQLILGSRYKAGILLSGNKNIDGQIVISKNQKTILRLPVLVSEFSIGLSIGAQTTGETFSVFKIDGLSSDTRISDMVDAYSGSTQSGTLSIPGPCCITLNGDSVKLQNSKHISLSGSFDSVGLMVDLSHTTMTLTADESFTDRIEFKEQTLGELNERAAEKNLISLDCKTSADSAGHFLMMNDFQEIVYKRISSNPADMFNSVKTRGLKPYLANDTLTLYPESRNNKVSGYRFDIDLNSETKIEKDFFGHTMSYSVKRSTADSEIKLTCLSKSSLNSKKQSLINYFNSSWKK